MRLLRRASTSILCFALWGVLHCGSTSHSQPGGSSSGGGSSDGGGNDTQSGDGGNNVVFSTSDGSVVDAAPVDICHVPPDNSNGNAPTCTKPPPPPNSFTPVSKWTWSPPTDADSGSNGSGSMVIPLVADMVDTNGDGQVNLCDTPSVIVTLNGGPEHQPGPIYMLSGDKGQVQAVFQAQVDSSITPALGDIDGDGLPEVVTDDPTGHLMAFDHTGKVKWTSTNVGTYFADEYQYCSAIAIYDLDGDGKPEIIDGFEVLDNTGKHLFTYDATSWAGTFWCPAPTAADLDGDGLPEVIFGNSAYHHDGTVYWSINGPPGQPQVADFDGDGVPEVFVARQDGLMLLTHDGQVISGPTQSFDTGVSSNCWSKAGAVGDFDGTGRPSIMDGSCAHFGVWHVSLGGDAGPPGLSLLWQQPISDPSGVAASTAFDFLGRGITDAVYGDEVHLWVYDGANGQLELQGDRSSGTLIEYPVVADVDNDGSADIVVISNTGGSGVYSNTVEVFQDAQKRWAPTRRIWNQHAYHVTNVREDGTIPAHMTPSWKYTNTFRMNAQIQAGGDCVPPPANPPK